MGYTTSFEGRFAFNKKLDKKTRTFLTKFSETRRIARKLPSKYGIEGEFYVDGDNDEIRGDTIIDYNRPPKTQPGLWCQWIPSNDGKYLEWDGGEKFYHYIEWLRYIIKNFLQPKNYMLYGEVDWFGERSDDAGKIEVKNNKITIYRYESKYVQIED